MSADLDQNSPYVIGMSVLWGTLASLIATFVAERLKGASIDFTIAEPVDLNFTNGQPRPAAMARFVRLRVANKQLPWPLRWLGRNALISCRARIDIVSRNGNPIFASSMNGRWAETPEPVPMQISIGGAAGQIVDHFRYDQTIDIPAGESRTLDVAAHFDSDVESYGWSNESYALAPNWRNPARVIPFGDYLVNVSIFHHGGRKSYKCRLSNKEAGLLLQKDEVP